MTLTPVEGSKGIRALVYNGEKIAEGTEKELKATLKDIFPHGAKDQDVSKFLDEFARISKLNRINKLRKIAYSGGIRGELPLTKKQIDDILDYSKKYGIKEEDISIADELAEQNTSYGLMFGQDRLIINTDVMSGALKTANSRLNWKAALAHELEGHRAAALAGKTYFDPSASAKINDLLEEVQASVRASLYGKDLNKVERFDLMQDAIERLQKNNLTLEEVIDKLWI